MAALKDVAMANRKIQSTRSTEESFDPTTDRAAEYNGVAKLPCLTDRDFLAGIENSRCIFARKREIERLITVKPSRNSKE